jgi:hypothetical protein
MKRFRLLAALLAAALMLGGGTACAEVQKFLNPCPGQKLCPSFRLVMTPPDGWVLDAEATKENDVQMLVPRGKTFANAQPIIYVQVFYHRDKQQTLEDFARLSNERWLATNKTAKISPLPPVARTNGKEGFLRFSFENPKTPQQAYEVGAFGIDDDKDGNQFVLNVVMSGDSKKALDRAEKDYLGFLKAY